MNLLVLDGPIPTFPALPEIDHVYVFRGWGMAESANEEIAQLLDLCASVGVPMTILTDNASSLSEDVLDQVASVEVLEGTVKEIPPQTLNLDDAIACIAWAGTDAQYDVLEFLQARGVTVLDMADGFARLEIGQTPDIEHMVDEITRRVTAAVLKTVREEIAELMSSRRWRSGAKRA